MLRAAESARNKVKRFNKLIILNGAYREPVVAIVAERRVEIAAVEVHVVRAALIVRRGRPIVAVVAHTADTRADAVARRRQENRTSSLHLRPLGKSVAVTCPVIVTR